LGNIASKLGAGRAKSGDKISFEVGFRLVKSIGDKIELNEPWLQVYHNHSDFNAVYVNDLIETIEFHDQPVLVESLIIKIMDHDHVFDI